MGQKCGGGLILDKWDDHLGGPQWTGWPVGRKNVTLLLGSGHGICLLVGFGRSHRYGNRSRLIRVGNGKASHWYLRTG